MGAVYQAYDLKLKREVALKILHTSLSHNSEFRDRFLQEAQSGARLKHPGIVQVHDIGEQGDFLYIVMDFVSGENLVSRMKALRAENRTMPAEEAIELVRQVSLALAYAHQNGVLHRDIKPANILLEPVSGDKLSGEKLPYRPVLTDLGLAKLLVGGLETQTGISMGTPAYMAPEQALGQAADARSDVYALGVLLYELVTGRLPFPLKTISEAVRCHMYEPPPLPPPLPEGTSLGLSNLLMDTLQRDRAKRPANAQIFAILLGSLLENQEEPVVGIKREDLDLTGMSTQRSHELAIGITPEEAAGPVASIWDKIKSSPEEEGVDQVELFAPGGEIHSIKLIETLIILGREEGCDIVLDDLKASRKHARLEFDGENYRLTDLNSTNGTFLGKNRLRPGVPELWDPETPARIGEHFLRLVRAKPAEGAKKARLQSTLVDLKAAALSEGGGRIGVAAPQTSLTVEAGSTAVLSFSMVNQGSQADHFNITEEGLPAGWVAEMPAPIQLMAGQSQEAALSIKPPRKPASHATRYPFILRVAAQSNPDEAVEIHCALTILPYTQFTSQLQPQRLQSGQSGKALVENQGNASETFTLKFPEHDGELVFSPPESRLKLGEGKSGEMAFHVRTKKMFRLGGKKAYSFKAVVAAERLPGVPGPSTVSPQAHAGEVVSRGWSWFLVALVSFCLVLAIGAAVAIPLLSDADHDGLNTLEEMRYGTNPNEADSDGDTIPDGTEVKSLGTDPLKRDTDGDGLNDFQEVSGCTNPLLADTDGDGIPDGKDAQPCSAEVIPEMTRASPTTQTPSPTPAEISQAGVLAKASIQPTRAEVGCPYLMQFTGTLTSDSPRTVSYRWERGDGTQSETRELTFAQAGSQTVTDEWQANMSGEFSDRLHILQPRDYISSPAYLSLTCMVTQASTFRTQVSVVPSSYSGICPAVFTFNAVIKADGPAEVHYKWQMSTGAYSDEAVITFNVAGSQKISYPWEMASSGIYSLQLHLISPIDIVSDEAVFTLDCTRTPITADNAAQVIPKNSLSGFDNPVINLAFDPGGSFLATASSTELWFWSVPDSILQLQTGYSGNVTGIAFSPDGTILAVSARDGWVSVEAMNGPANLTHLYNADSPNGETMDGVAFAPYGGVLTAFSQDGKIFFWDLIQERWVETLEGGPLRGMVLSLAFSKSGRYLAAGTFAGDIPPLGKTFDDDVYIWQPRTYDYERTMIDPGCFWVSKVVFSPVDETLLAVGNISDGNVRLWRVSDGTVLRRLPIGDVGQSLAFSPDGSLLATNYGMQIILWKVATGDVLAILSGHSGKITSLAFSPDGNFLASASDDRTVILWSVGGR